MTEDQRTSLRESNIAWLGPEIRQHRWLFGRIKDCVNKINRNWFGYEGGEIVLDKLFSKSEPLSRALGSTTCFPPYTIHEATPVTRGVWYSLVGWPCGPAFV